MNKAGRQVGTHLPYFKAKLSQLKKWEGTARRGECGVLLPLPPTLPMAPGAFIPLASPSRSATGCQAYFQTREHQEMAWLLMKLQVPEFSENSHTC